MKTLMVFAFFVIVAAPAIESRAARAECLDSSRQVASDKGSIGIKSYTCGVDGSREPKIRVEFDRLSEAAAGSLVEDEPYSDLSKFYGAPEVKKNDVYAVAKGLFDAYGYKERVSTCYALNLASAAGGTSGSGTCGGKRTLWYFSFPDQMDLTSQPFPEAMALHDGNRSYPKGWSFFYQPCRSNQTPMDCTFIWRPVTLADLQGYVTKVKQYEAKIGVPHVEDNDSFNPGEGGVRYFSLVTHLANGDLPKDFLTAVSDGGAACGCGDIISGIYIRQMILEVALITNISKEPMSIDGLLGATDASKDLRLYRKADSSADPITLMQSFSVAPGKTLVVPLRINFVQANNLHKLFVDQKTAAATYASIMKFAPGTVFSNKDCDMSRLREDFRSPEIPPETIYSYGPALNLKGLSISGQPMHFDRTARNFLRISAGDGYGSCPYLYAFDHVDNTFVRLGKVLDGADTDKKQRTQTVTLPGLTTTFELQEKEFELGYIWNVGLSLQLSDGTTLVLVRKDHLSRPEAPGAYETLSFGQTRRYVFEVPADVKPESVVSSALSITGYYRRYSSMAVAK